MELKEQQAQKRIDYLRGDKNEDGEAGDTTHYDQLKKQIIMNDNE